MSARVHPPIVNNQSFAAFCVRLQALCKQLECKQLEFVLEFVHMRLLGPETEGNESCAMNESPRAGSWGLQVARGIGTAARHPLSDTTYTDFFFVRA